MTLDPTFAAAVCTSDADDDRELVQRYRRGDVEAFTTLVVRYRQPVVQAAFWVLRRTEDAHDVAQTVFLKAAEHIADYDPRFKFFSWIYRIAVNEALNVQRRLGREEPLDDDVDLPDDQRPGPEEQLEAAQRQRALRAALMRLTAQDRLVITLRHFQELSYAEIAEVLEIEEHTVKSRLYEARQRLQTLLAGWKRGRR